MLRGYGVPPRCHASSFTVRKSWQRNASYISQTYPSKVRAYPFALSPEEAIIQMSLSMSMYCVGLGRGFWSSLGARIFPGLGFQPVLPVRIKALYIPAWFVDAEFVARGWLSKTPGGQATERRLSASFEQSYMPGVVYQPLSSFSLRSPALAKAETTPFSDKLRRQHGSDVICLPFELTPFHLADAVQSLSYQQVTVSDRLRIKLSTVKTDMMAAYPVLIPIYLAEYEVLGINNEVHKFTAILEAWTKMGRMMVENVYRWIVDTKLREDPNPPRLAIWGSKKIPSGPFWLWGFSPKNAHMEFAKSELWVRATKYEREQRILDAWINAGWRGRQAVYQERFFPKVSDRKVDWEDLRIREYIPSEVEPIRHWMSLGKEWTISQRFFMFLIRLSLWFKMQKRAIARGEVPGEESERASSSDGMSSLDKKSLESAIEYVRKFPGITHISPWTYARRRKEEKPVWLQEWERRMADGESGLPKKE